MILTKTLLVIFIHFIRFIIAITLPEDYNKSEVPSNTTSEELVQVTCKFHKFRIHGVDIEDSSMQLSMKLEFSWNDYRIDATSTQKVSFINR